MQEMLQKWWTKKYNLPWNHELFQERTLFDLLVEFELDWFEKNPLEAHRNEDGHIQFKNTGDNLIDKWEQQIADGSEPSYDDMLTPEVRAKLARMRKRGDARTSGVGSFKDVMESVATDAVRQGLSVHPNQRILDRALTFKRSNFGDGTE